MCEIHQTALKTFHEYWNKYHGSVSIENALMPNTTITKNEWRQAGDKLRKQQERIKTKWELRDHCKYCANEDPESCDKCGILQALQDEREGFNQ